MTQCETGPTRPPSSYPTRGPSSGWGSTTGAPWPWRAHRRPSRGLTTFELGTWMGEWFALDPNGLITREEVFHDADSLVASGLMR